MHTLSVCNTSMFLRREAPLFQKYFVEIQNVSAALKVAQWCCWSRFVKLRKNLEVVGYDIGAVQMALLEPIYQAATLEVVGYDIGSVQMAVL